MSPPYGEMEEGRDRRDSSQSVKTGRATWNRITELAGEVWDMEAPECDAYLTRECAGDESLRAEVEELLRDKEQVSDFLQEGPVTRGDLDFTGMSLGSYVIEDKIGEGGMGVVYRARDTRLGRPLAIKIVRPSTIYGRKRRKQFLHEARVTAALHHPNIVTIYDVGSTDKVDFIAMEYLEGATVGQRLMTEGPLPLRDVLRIGDRLLTRWPVPMPRKYSSRPKAWEHHRRAGWAVKVLDFGIAKHLGQPPTVSATVHHFGEIGDYSVATTVAGTIAGTVCYMSPEHAAGAKVDERSNLFSFGAVLFEMIREEKPSRVQTRQRHWP